MRVTCATRYICARVHSRGRVYNLFITYSFLWQIDITLLVYQKFSICEYYNIYVFWGDTLTILPMIKAFFPKGDISTHPIFLISILLSPLSSVFSAFSSIHNLIHNSTYNSIHKIIFTPWLIFNPCYTIHMYKYIIYVLFQPHTHRRGYTWT